MTIDHGAPFHLKHPLRHHLFYGSLRGEVQWQGDHSRAGPQESSSAHDALVLAYNAISMLRQQLRPTDLIHGMITSGGSRINVIPSLAQASFQIRSKDEYSLGKWTERIVNCFEAGALATERS